MSLQSGLDDYLAMLLLRDYLIRNDIFATVSTKRITHQLHHSIFHEMILPDPIANYLLRRLS